MRKVLASGSFDPFHLGHLYYLKAAKQLGDQLIVIVDGDGLAIKKHGKVFMPLEDRLAIIENLKCVDVAIVWGDGELGDMADAIRYIKPEIFAKSGDRNSLASIPELEVQAAKEINCNIDFNVGGGSESKIRASSDIISNYYKKKRR